MDRAAVSVVSKIGQVLVDELQDIRGVGNKVVQLQDELATMNAVLRVISEADQDKVDHIVREWEKQVHVLVYDAEDCTDTYSLRIRRPIARPSIYARAKRAAKYPYKKLVLQRALAADIKDLLVRTTAVSERRARYNIDRATLPRAANLAPVSGSSISADALRRADNPDQFVGITEQANTLAGKIKAAAVDEGLNVFSIVGFGGLGKTTLAMELCRQLDADFPCQALVSVSQAFDAEQDLEGLLVRVRQQILKEKQPDGQQTITEDGKQTITEDGKQTITEDGKQTITEDKAVGSTHGDQLQIDHTDVDDSSKKIKELLDHKRSLIVVDDVWSLRAWEAIRIRLLEKNCNSIIIVTTRIEAVARAASISEDFVHHMEPLELKASEELFVKRVFGSMAACPDGLKKEMNTILKKCGGFPLAIVSIASLLASYISAEGIAMWERVSRSIGSQLESHPTLEGMRQLIALSYDYLPHHLKACMLYLSIFPEDYVIAKDRLLYKWIAEGLIIQKRGLTLLEVAEEYFDELISRNMIQLDKIVLSGGEVEGCRVHDMILEVMVSKSEESNFVSLVGRQYGVMPHGHGKVRRVSFHDSNHDEQHKARHGIEAMKVHHIRSVTTFPCDGLDKLMDRLGEFKLMRVLDLEDCKALRDKHMGDVCRLYLLRFLSLKGTLIGEMPEKIGNLEHLETLDIRNTYIKKMPPTVTRLSKLQRLMSDGWLLPRGLGNMKALGEVDTGVLDGDDVPWVTQEIGQLLWLQALSIRIEGGYQTDEFMKESFPKLALSLSKSSTLRSLNLECLRWSLISLEFLLSVSTPPPLLRYLRLYGSISQLPNWIASLRHLTKLEVGWTKLAGDRLLCVLCKLPNLQSILLEEIRWKEGELVAHPKHSFPMLRILKVVACPPKLTFKEGSMTKLRTLALELNEMEMSIVGVEHLKNLKEVKLRGWKAKPSMQRAVEQLETLSKFNQIKVVVDWR